MKPKINIVMVGHVDHGKSTLIGRLLYDTKSIKPGKLKEIEQTAKKLGKKMEFAFILDSLQEEREGGITIDTTQIPFETEKYRYNIIDAPGHREFIKNMLSGASNAEAGVVLVSAKSNEGVQEQTRRHVFLLKLFGVKQIFFAVNKMDTVDYSKKRFEEIKDKTMVFLNSFGYGENLHFVPISARCGENIINKSKEMEWYTGLPLVRLLDEKIKPKTNPLEKPLRIPVQLVQERGGEKIIMGRVESGSLKAGDDVIFKPSGIKGKIKKIEEKEKAVPGDSVGFRLTDNLDVKRGDVCGLKNRPPSAYTEFTSKIFILSERGVQTGDVLDFRCNTSLVKGKIISMLKRIDSETGEIIEDNPKKLHLNDAGVLKVKLSSPMVLEKFEDIPELGRLMIENKGGVVAAGIISEF